MKWEYKGQDGGIHIATTKQMLEWRSMGYFTGESAVDIRQLDEGKGGGGG